MNEDLKVRWMAMCLRMLSQILIKTHAGPKWGFGEETILQMMRDADVLTKELDGQGLEPLAGRKEK